MRTAQLIMKIAQDYRHLKRVLIAHDHASQDASVWLLIDRHGIIRGLPVSLQISRRPELEELSQAERELLQELDTLDNERDLAQVVLGADVEELARRVARAWFVRQRPAVQRRAIETGAQIARRDAEARAQSERKRAEERIRGQEARHG